MKISDAKKVATLIELLNEHQKQLAAVTHKPMELNFGGYTFHLAKKIEDDLRERIKLGQILEVEKTREELTKLGVEL